MEMKKLPPGAKRGRVTDRVNEGYLIGTLSR